MTIYVKENGTLLYGVLNLMENQILEISTALLHDIPDTQVIKVGYGQPYCGCWLSWAVTHFEARYLEDTADILSRGVCRHPLYPDVLVDPVDGTEVDSSGTKMICVKGNMAKTVQPRLPTLYGGKEDGFSLQEAVAQTFDREARMFLLRVVGCNTKPVNPNVIISVVLSRIDVDNPKKYVIKECYYQLTDLAENRGVIVTLPKSETNLAFTFGPNQVKTDGCTYPSHVMFKSGPYNQTQFGCTVFQQIPTQSYLDQLYNHTNAQFFRGLIIIGGEWSIAIDIGCDIQKRLRGELLWFSLLSNVTVSVAVEDQTDGFNDTDEEETDDISDTESADISVNDDMSGNEKPDDMSGSENEKPDDNMSGSENEKPDKKRCFAT